MGFGGFFMHSRTGLQTEYLGEDWFRLTDACIKRAQELGMEPWIYDEDRWPSGCAGGLVTKEPPFRRKYLTLTLNEAADSSEPPLAVFAARIDGAFPFRRATAALTGCSPRNEAGLPRPHHAAAECL